ncbi:unnamed protein product, partial [Mesorhabditis belari]|uniref:Transforming acidic coiled-coil-containing protein C-terminal domain-containing protein n=1 Tax=Mesorhabditis belari TaxID=2138241 RepID=A0AAF3EEB8_9BILA
MAEEENECDDEPTTFRRSEITKTITRPHSQVKRNLPIIETPQPVHTATSLSKPPLSSTQPIQLPALPIDPKSTGFLKNSSSSIEKLEKNLNNNEKSDSNQNALRLDEKTNMASSSTTASTVSVPKGENAPIRTRQHTVTVLSTGAQEVKTAFAALKATENPINSDELERRMLALVTKIEKETLTKLDKIRKDSARELARMKEQGEANQRTLELNTQELHRQIENFANRMPNMATMTASTLMSPDDTRSLKKERDQLEMELKAVHDAYRNMFNMYDKLKALNRDLKEDNDQLREVEGIYKEQLLKGQEKYLKMVEQAKERLNQANECILSLEKRSEDDTITLRAKLKRTELQLNATMQQLEIKKKECQELNEICQALLAKAEIGSDSDA